MNYHRRLDFKTIFKDKYLLLAIILAGVGIAIWYIFNGMAQNATGYGQDIEKNIHRELQILEEELAPVKEKVASISTVKFLDLRVKTKYPYFLFSENQLVFWSDNKLAPGFNDLNGAYRHKLVSINEGLYLSSRHDVNDDYVLFSIIPIYIRNKINNKYLQSGFNPEIFSGLDLSVSPRAEGDYSISDQSGEFLFSTAFGKEYKLQNQPAQYLVLFIFCLGILFVVLWMYRVLQLFVKEGNVLGGMIFFGVSLLLVRSLMLWAKFPFDIVNFDIFNSRFFASSSINPSLGDLFLNVIVFIVWINFLFQNYFKSKVYMRLIQLKSKAGKVFSQILIFSSYFLLLGVYELMMNLQKHAQWSIDITESIDFSSPLKWMSLLILFFGALAYFSLSHIAFRTFISLNATNANKYIYFQVIIAAVAFMLLNIFISWPFILLAIVHSIYFVVAFNLSLTRKLVRVSYLTFVYLFICVIACATVGAYTVYKFHKKKSISEIQNFGSQLLDEKDIIGEYLVDDAVNKIKNDIFIGVTFSNLFSSKEIVKQKIKRRHLSSYLDRYDIDIYLFDQRGVPLDHEVFIENYYQFTERYARKDQITEFSNIYRVNNFETDLQKGYMAFVPIYYERFRSNVGHVILSFKLKRVIPNSVYPELLVDKNQFSSGIMQEVGYILYQKGRVEYTSGLFDVRNDFREADLNNSALFSTGIQKGKSKFFGIKGENDKVIVLSTNAYPFKNVLANFSFFFLLLIFAILLIIVFYAIKFEYKGANLNFATKIQLYLNFAFFLPLFAVSITTLSLLNSSYKTSIKNEYYAKAESLSGNISSLLEGYFLNLTNKEALSSKLVEISKFVESDLNLFNTNGKLIASTHPLIYENGLLSENVHPVAIEAVIENGDRLLLDESVGTLAFKNTYYGIKSYQTGEIISILSIPFFESEKDRDHQIIDVLSNIIVTFTFIFILFSALSYFASRFLTSPLRYITQKIKKISLSGTNTPMVWNSNDEIGLLVGEYNKMLINLEASKKALARSEKESAWREMAQQVAHEIKNPLTPMKLNLQHLKRTLSQQGEVKDDYTNKSINNLLHQIDTLSDIATSFSAFAKMPIPENERLELTEAVKSAINLYINDKDIDLETQIENGPIYVIGDVKLLGRIINNLIINGIQSVPESVTPRIAITLSTANKKAVIAVKDNGSGISDRIAEKVFIPNFSTKATGSGIGLAISKRGIEQVGGSIWFETKEDEGTTFFIELPMVD